MIRITTDTGCDLSPEILEKYHVGVVSLYISMGDKSLKDGVECFPEDVFAYVEKTKKTPKTSAPPIGDFVSLFQSTLKEEGCEGIVHISINSAFSCSYQNAVLAANEVEGEVHVVDSATLSSMQGLHVLRACELAREGKTAAEIAEIARQNVRLNNSDFVLGGIEYAARGGRCPMFLAISANLLKLRPLMSIDPSGKISSPKKFRGSFLHTAEAYVDYQLRDPDNIDYSRVCVSISSDEPQVRELVRKKLESVGRFGEILISRTNCTTATHGGPETIAIFFFKKRSPEARRSLLEKLPIPLPFRGRDQHA